MIPTVLSEATTQLAAGKRTIVEDLRATLEQLVEIKADRKEPERWKKTLGFRQVHQPPGLAHIGHVP